MFRKILGAAAIAVAANSPVFAEDGAIIVQSTTSTANSGLYDHILPIFEGKTGIKANVVAVGTGQAIRNAQNCDGDVLLVHAKPAEEKFVADGYGTGRTDLMYNDFIIVGPAEDPAGVTGMTDAQAALKKIAGEGALFASRGDDSGTHKKEVSLWKDAGVDPDAGSGQWYRETGSGMGATLNAGIGMGAYVMTDRATWISFANKQDYEIAVEGDEDLFNQYGVIPVNPDKCPSVNVEAANAFSGWLLSPEGQAAIAEYKVDGQQLFFPNAPSN
ncbi:substrate-binding domain-containing protein [Chachezhania antarctica]|uniref:substrate-binding domain-containing protein n=1 Tax=Chachezhania antarctica TaxID=2340860 RepID=UPI000EABC139|nr:substrate-binding domain-containing protein [Chachezhania antarctica]|tara:strand:- start:6831 stop:7649 length:819 start_codon:yes stop_codon:yes gene_type:complete